MAEWPGSVLAVVVFWEAFMKVCAQKFAPLSAVTASAFFMR